MRMGVLTGLPQRGMAVIAEHLNMLPVIKKYSNIAEDITLGCSCSDFSTKIHLAIDNSSLSLNIVLSLGQALNSQFTLRLLDDISLQPQKDSMKHRSYAILTDKAYAGTYTRHRTETKKIKAVIPEKLMKK